MIDVRVLCVEDGSVCAMGWAPELLTENTAQGNDCNKGLGSYRCAKRIGVI